MPYTDNGEIYYTTTGRGLPLTLIHGVGGDLEVWDKVVGQLPDDYRILRLDLRGHGQSVKLPGSYSLEQFARNVLIVLDEVSFQQTHLVGFSLGGLVAQQIALDAPDRLLSLSLISTVAGRTEAEREQALARARNLKENGADQHLEQAFDRWFSDEFTQVHPELLAWRRQKSLQNDPLSYAVAYQVLAESDLAHRLPAIEMPTLAMTGAADIGSTPRMCQLIAQQVANGRSIILPHIRHAVLLEAPERIAAEINHFISNHVLTTTNEVFGKQ